MRSRPAILIPVIAAALLPVRPLAAQQTFDPANPPSSPTPPTEIYHEYTGEYSHQKGPKTVLVFLVQPIDGAAWTSPPSFATLDSQLNTASSNYYNIYSHRQAWFGPKRRNGMDIPRLVVTPVLNLPSTTQAYKDGFGLLQSDCLAAARALGGVWGSGQVNDYNNFDRWVVMSNTKLISSTGLAYVGGRFAWTGGGLAGGVAEHEWGHNWGVYHANAWNVADGADPRSSAGSSEEYGDGWDLMGGNTVAAGFNPLFREDLGFLERSRNEIVDVTTSGTYRLYDYIHPDRRQPSALTRGLIIPMSSFTDRKRLFLGFGHVAAGSDARTVWNRNAVTMHTELGVNGSSRIDTTPGSRQTGDAEDSSIKIGRTYSEGPNVNGTQIYGGFHITPTARGADTVNGQTHEWIDVVVNYQNAISGNQPPVASFAQTQYAAPTGNPLTIAVTASDPDGNALAYDWDFGDGTVSTTNSASQTKTWTSAGLYLVSCTVSDMKGGNAKASCWVNAGAVSSQNPQNPSGTLPGFNYRYYEGTFATMPDFTKLLPLKSGTVETLDISPRTRNDNFAFQFVGYVNVPATDIYTFKVTSDDGARLFIGNTLVVDNSAIQSAAFSKSGNIALNAGNHQIRVEYFHKDGPETLGVEWSTLTSPSVALPAGSISQIDPGTNAAPLVSLVQPTDNASYIVGSDILLQADAADADGIASVAFFADGGWLATDTSAPYSFSWPKVSVGTKAIVALACDAVGNWMQSSPVTITVASPPRQASIGLNLNTEGAADGRMYVDDVSGAVYQQENWNNLAGISGSATTVKDYLGNTVEMPVAWVGTANTNYGDGLSNADISTAPGRMFKGLAEIRQDEAQRPSLTATNVPYPQYDIYVYFDLRGSDAKDTTPQRFVCTPTEGAAPADIFGKNSLLSTDGVGDYPNYDTWVGFKESTATTATASNDELLGNYVVFRNVRSSGFTVKAERQISGTQQRLGFNAVQIVETPLPDGVPAVRLQKIRGSALAEGGGSAPCLAWLAAEPDSDVTITISPGSQLAADKATLTFTSTNWQTPQVVLVSAVDDSDTEGAHTGTLAATVTASGNYAAISAPSVSYTITDNDTPEVGVNVVRQAAEHATTPRVGLVRFTRNNIGSYAAPLTVNFVATGTASLIGDYTLSNASVTFDTASGEGSLVIPAGQAQVVLTLSPSNDAVAELQEKAELTLQPGAAYTVGVNSSATVSITDDDAVDFLTEPFSNNLGTNLFDLNNLSITFTPSGGTYTAQTARVTAFPSGTSGFTPYDEASMSSGTSDDGVWNQALAPSFTYFGVSYNSLRVSTNGHVFFGSTTYNGNDLNGSAEAHFVAGSPRIAGLGTDLNPATGGTVNYKRVTTAGEQRHVFFYNAVRFYTNSNTTSFQIELFDDGRIRITHIGSTLISPSIVGLSSGVSPTMPSSPFESTSMPRPFFPSDLSLYGEGTVSNAAPVFGSQPVTSATAGQTYSYAIVAADANNDTLAFSAPTKPAWLTLTPTGPHSATLTGTPPAAGNYAVTVQVRDGTAATNQSFSIATLRQSGENTAPVFTSTPATLASTGVVYSYTVSAADADGHSITLDAAVKPSWLTLTPTGAGTAILSGTAPVGVPTPVITLSATDGFATTLQTYSLTVNASPAVAITRPVESIITLADLTTDLHLTGTATDDGQPNALFTTWTMTSGPDTAVFSSPHAMATRVSFPTAGHYILRLTGSDGTASVFDEIQVYAGGADPNAVRSNALAGYWKFDEATGTTAADISGNNRNATFAGASSWNATGYSGAALSQTASATSAFASYAYGSAHPSALTVAAWINLSEMPVNADRHIFDTASESTPYLRVYVSNGSRKISVRSKRNTDGIWNAEYLLPSNAWVHVAVSYDASSVANDPVVYINGVSVPVTEVTAPVGTATSQATGRFGVNWKGSLDEVRLYSRLVPGTEIAALAVPGPFNAAPEIGAGQDIDAAAGGTVALDYAVSDDGLPASPGALELLWTIDSGPDGGSFADTASAASYFTTAGAGKYVLRLGASDGSITVSRTLIVTAASNASGYTAWKTLHFPGEETNPLLGGDAADSDSDGLPNLLEYALGGDPSISEPGLMPGVLAEGGSLTLSFERPKGLAGIVYSVEASTDLVSWSDSGVSMSVTGDHGATETVGATVPLSGQRQFLRLKILLVP